MHTRCTLFLLNQARNRAAVWPGLSRYSRYRVLGCILRFCEYSLDGSDRTLSDIPQLSLARVPHTFAEAGLPFGPAKVRGEPPRLVAILRGPPSTEEHLPKVFPYMLKKNWKG